MDKVIKDFPKQLGFEPVIENAENLRPKNKFVVCGMGGSHLAADLIKAARSDLDLVIHSNYGLPFDYAQDKPKKSDLNERLVIINSYSGNTEEALDSFGEAFEKKLNLAAISIGGKLLEEARSKGVAFVRIPDTGIQPRMAVGFSVLALLKLMGEDEEIAEVKKLAVNFDSGSENVGKELAKKLEGKIPVIYASEKNSALALNWKAIFNETGKIPAFYNVFPELNHNEMTGFDSVGEAKELSRNFSFIFLRDPEDDPRIARRMDITQKLLKKRGFVCHTIGTAVPNVLPANIWHKIFSSILLAEWTAYHLALYYGADPEQVPMVEEFKKLIA
ncbi:MAG: hypothetical protein HYY55_01520 [Candidatus Niyogibacteria bacterium]|nr:MAG: hypothetical protein HYY55_01520 [Candidatus Niyogibacteria bacterium]